VFGPPAQPASGRQFMRPEDSKELVDRVGKSLEALNRPVLPASFTFAAPVTSLSPWVSTYQRTAATLQSNLQSLENSLASAERAGRRGEDPSDAIRNAHAMRAQVRNDLAMLAQSQAQIQQEQLVAYPACAEVFTAEHQLLAESAATILGREISADAWPVQRRGWPLTYAYVQADYTCGPRRERVRYLSQVFSYCGPEVSPPKVLSDNAGILRQVVNASCAAPAGEVTRYVVRESSPAAAERARASAARSGGRIVPWTASVESYGLACR
jgi:hypothetical protein